MRPALFAALLVVCIAFRITSAWTADAALSLTPEEKQAFIAAVARAEPVAVRAIVVAAVARDSNRLSGIVRDVFELAPQHADAIVKHLGEVFPQLGGRLKDIVADRRAVEAKRRTSESPPSEAAAVPEPGPKPLPVQSPWSGETVLGGRYRSAAKRAVTANARFKLSHEKAPWRDSITFEFDYGETNDVTNTQSLFIGGRSRRDLNERLYGFGMVSYEDDRFSGFDYQITEAVGLGFRLFDLADFDLDLEGGPSLRQSRVSGTGEFNREVLLRFATNLTWHISDTATFTNETALFFSRNSVEVSSESFGALRDGAESTNTTALDLQVIGNLAARLSYEVHYRSDPPPDGVTTESISKVSLVHSF